MQSSVKMVLMRGGTSKCAMFHKNHLPINDDERDRMLLSIFGSPDPRQIDGIGGGISSTSKACIIAPSERDDADIDYTFGQVEILEPSVDYHGNCGNCSSAVGPFAIEEGLIRAQEGITTVRIFNTNTEKLIVAEVPVKDARPVYQGDLQIAGVPGTGAAQRLWFHDPGGSVSGQLLPTGNPVDIINLGEGLDSVEVSLVDAANPVVFVRAKDIGLTGIESPQELDQPSIAAILEKIRCYAAVWLGLASVPSEAVKKSPALPKVAIVGPPQEYRSIYKNTVEKASVNLVARMISLGKCHTAFPVTGAIATASAAKIRNTVVHQVAKLTGGKINIGHPSGIIPVDIDIEEGEGFLHVRRAGVYRTARRVIDGSVYFKNE